MPKPCPCTHFLTFPKRTRRIGFVDTLARAGSTWGKLDAIVCSESPERTRHYRARVLCGCEPGWTRVGAGTALLYGRNGLQLEGFLAECPDPIVVIALYEGTRSTGGTAGRLVRELIAVDREALIVRFHERPIVDIDPARPPGQRAQVVHQWSRS